MKSITEEMGLQKEWMEEVKGMTLENLPDFLKELTEDYNHDYGTICHAIAAAAVAAASAVERSPQGGISGFQAGATTWEFIKGWGSPTLGKSGSRFTNYDNLLFPQYKEDFTTIPRSVWDSVVSKAKEYLTEKEDAAEVFIKHWESIAAGVVPFGLRVL